MENNILLDVFDENYNHIGVDTYLNIHTKGLWHHNFHCWIVNPETMKVLIIQLPKKHLMMPSKLDVAIFGQMFAGEDVIEGRKEIEEKFGIEIKKENLVKIGITQESCFVKSRNIYNNVFSHSYLLKNNIPLENFVGKVRYNDAIFEADVNDVLDLFSDKQDKIWISGYDKHGKPIKKNVSYDEFALRGKAYLYKVLYMITQWLEMEEWENKYHMGMSKENGEKNDKR